MSNPATVIVQLRTACHHCFTSQIDLLVQSDRVSRNTKVDTTNLFIYLHQLNELDPLPDPDEETVAEIAAVGAVTDNVTDEEELEQLRDKLADLLRKVGNLKEITEEETESALTYNLLNKRMVDLLYLMRPKIRNARRRLKTDDGSPPGYDQEAYKMERKKASLAQHTYLALLNNDSVLCTHEEVATLERNLYPAIDEATAYSFVESLRNLASFLQARVLA